MATTNVIVAGVDGSESALNATRWAAAEAKRRGLDLRVVHVWGVTGGYYGGGLPLPASVVDALEQDAQRVLDEAVATARETEPDLAVTGEMPCLAPIPHLVELSRTARMIVLGSTGRGGFTGMLLGSTAVAVSAHAHCPVAVIRGQEHSGPVVVGIDGSAASEPAIEVAFDEASQREVPLVALHVWSDLDYDSAFGSTRYLAGGEGLGEEEQRVLAESLAGWQEKYPDVVVQRVVVRDRARDQLLEWSKRAALVVVGCRGRGGFRGLLLGSTSQALIHHAECPVLVTRAGS
jgi:nucleotide-binding universal stress UspA family protein